ncbi:hypothetical protein B0H16DRAFT_1470638 [Mycena metata]|uniref:Uncharacterized protein n=1 Tax=Mycena metata TaxID=1033252 RepID=A0AAD7HVF7_9AGAR|nr:hypothetical protein B0H16DRAFT_1470638 [Mycena metata]
MVWDPIRLNASQILEATGEFISYGNQTGEKEVYTGEGRLTFGSIPPVDQDTLSSYSPPRLSRADLDWALSSGRGSMGKAESTDGVNNETESESSSPESSEEARWKFTLPRVTARPVPAPSNPLKLEPEFFPTWFDLSEDEDQLGPFPEEWNVQVKQEEVEESLHWDEDLQVAVWRPLEGNENLPQGDTPISSMAVTWGPWHGLCCEIPRVNSLGVVKDLDLAQGKLARIADGLGKSRANLKDAGAGQGENGTDVRIHALASSGKTRFATHFMAVDTVEPALNPIHELVVQGVVKFKDPDLQELFEDPYSSAFLEFAKDLLRYKIIVRPLAQTLWSLEATTANPSDAMVFWLAAAHALDSVFAQDPAKTHISAALAGYIRAAFNDRYHQFFSHSDIYFVAFCLDPRAYTARRDYLGIQLVIIYVNVWCPRQKRRLTSSFRTRLRKHDSGCNCHPIFKRKTSLEIVRRAPFHAPILNDDAMEWWENLEIGYSPCSGALAMLAVRIFGILANSMPDERTNSNITWFSSPLRGNQKAENLLDMILVGRWHTYHAEGVKVRRPRQNPTVAFRRLNPELLEKVKHKAADDSSSDSETDSDSDRESDSPTVVAESVPSNTVVSAPAVGEEPSHSKDEALRSGRSSTQAVPTPGGRRPHSSSTNTELFKQDDEPTMNQRWTVSEIAYHPWNGEVARKLVILGVLEPFLTILSQNAGFAADIVSPNPY